MTQFRDAAVWEEMPPRDEVFTTLRGTGGVAIDVARHAERLARDAQRIGLTSAPGAVHIKNALSAVASQLAATWPHVRLRASIAAPPASAWVWIEAQPYLEDSSDTPVSLWPLVTNPIPHAHIKRSARAAYDAALASARRHGADDAMLVDPNGHWLEATRFAIVGVVGNTLRAPSLEGILPSIGRARVFDLAREMGLDVALGPLDSRAVHSFSEVLVVNSLRGVRAVGRCGELAWSAPGVVTKALSKAYAGFMAQAILNPAINPYNRS